MTAKVGVARRQRRQDFADRPSFQLHGVLLPGVRAQRSWNQVPGMPFQISFVEPRPIVAEVPDGDVARGAAIHGNDHIGQVRPGMIEVVLRRPGRFIGMRMIKADERAAALARARLGRAVAVRSDPEPAARRRRRSCSAARSASTIVPFTSISAPQHSYGKLCGARGCGWPRARFSAITVVRAVVAGTSVDIRTLYLSVRRTETARSAPAQKLSVRYRVPLSGKDRHDHRRSHPFGDVRGRRRARRRSTRRRAGLPRSPADGSASCACSVVTRTSSSARTGS